MNIQGDLMWGNIILSGRDEGIYISESSTLILLIYVVLDIKKKKIIAPYQLLIYGTLL